MSETTIQKQERPFSTLGFAMRLALFAPGLYFGMTAIELLIFAVAPLVSGKALSALYRALSGQQ